MNSLSETIQRTMTNGISWRATAPYAAIALIVLIMHLPGLFTLPPLDRDESRYAQATVQMFETGNFVDIRFQDAPRHKKPVGIHWLQAISVSLFSDPAKREIWAFRLPSLFGVILACLFTYWGTSRLFNPRIGFISALLLPSTLVVAGEATIAKTDGVLLACLTASQLSLARLYVESRQSDSFDVSDLDWLWRITPLALIFWIALAIGTLVKGPVAPVVTTLTCASMMAIDRRFGWMKGLAPAVGGAIALAIVLPWVIAVWIQTDGQFFMSAFLADVGPKMVSNQETHGGPPGYYTLLSPLLLWPMTLFVAPAFFNAWRMRLSPPIKFCLAWIISTWLFFEINPTKLPHYVLPTFPAIAAVCAVYIFRQKSAVRGEGSRTQDLLHLGSAVFWLILSVAIAAFAGLLPVLFVADVKANVIFGSIAIGTVAILVYLMQIHAQRQMAAYGVVALAAISFYVILQIVLPSVNQLDISRNLKTAILEHHDGQMVPVISSGYAEPSFVFLTASDTKLVPPDNAAEILASMPDAVAVIERRIEPDFLKRAEELSLKLDRIATVDGFNYSNGNKVSLTLFKGKVELRPAIDETAPSSEDLSSEP